LGFGIGIGWIKWSFREVTAQQRWLLAADGCENRWTVVVRLGWNGKGETGFRLSIFSVLNNNTNFIILIFKISRDTWQLLIRAKTHAFPALKAPKCPPIVSHTLHVHMCICHIIKTRSFLQSLPTNLGLYLP